MLEVQVFMIQFDEHCTGWCNDKELNLTFIKQLERLFRAVLKLSGQLTVAAVVTAFGAPMGGDIKYYQYGWDNEDELEFRVVPYGNSSFAIALAGTKKIM